MQLSSKLIYKTAIMLTALLLVTAVFVVIGQTQQANAMSTSQWDIVRTAINDYINNQYVSSDAVNGESGFRMSRGSLQDRIDNNGAGGVGDGTYLGEGDDVANAPVLIDDLMGQATIIPGTSYRCGWNTNCFESGNITSVQELVNAHNVAGFSTDIVVYCLTGQTEAPTSGAYGFIAQTGALGQDTKVTPRDPHVYAFEFGRNGWQGTQTTAAGGNTPVAADAAPSPLPAYAANGTDCGITDPVTTDAQKQELVRCTARQAIYSSLGNVGNGGDATAKVPAAGQTVDVRDGATTTFNTSARNQILPINTLFSSDLSKVDPTATVLVGSRTPMIGGITAQGLKMLGYNTQSAGAFITGGNYAWSTTMGESPSPASPSDPGFALLSPGAYSVPAKVDNVAPVIASSSAVATSGTTATVSRTTTGEPATSKIALTGSDSSTVNKNDTVLNFDKSGATATMLTGLNPGVTYTGTLTIYDAQANASSTPISFTTPVPGTTAPVVSNIQPANGSTITMTSSTVSADYSDAGGIDTSTAALTVTGATVSGCSANATSISCTASGMALGSHTINVSVKDTSGNQGSGSSTFTVADNTQPPVVPPVTTPAPFDAFRYGLENEILFIANGRASNVAVIDVAQMSFVDYIPVPKSPINAGAEAGQLGGVLDKSIRGLSLGAPASVPDMFYWEIHGVVPSADRGSIYAIGALAMTPSDFTMYQVNTKTHNTDREIPLAPSVVGYCGLEYDLNDESSGVLYAENMQTGPGDLAMLTGLPLQLRDPLAGLLPTLGLGGLLNTVENQLSLGVGGLSEENLASGTNTRYIATDWDGDGNASTCGIAWDASGQHAFASQMFTPLIDTLDWNTKTLTGQFAAPNPYKGNTQHQSTSAKTRDLLLTADGVDGVAVYSMSLKTLVARFDINSMAGHTVATHGVEIAPDNENVLYVLGDGAPTGMYVVDIADIHAPQLIGGMEGGFDPNACGTYAIADKQNYYQAAGKCEKPDLNIKKTGAFWENYAAYQARELSVNFSIGNSGNIAASNVAITEIWNAPSTVTVSSPMPIAVGDVTNTSSATATIKYMLPPGVSSFSTHPTATADSPCGTTYTYPGSGGVGSLPPAPPQDA